MYFLKAPNANIADIRDFGAVSDGISPINSALQAAWDHVLATSNRNSHPKFIFAPKGNWAMDGRFQARITDSNTTNPLHDRWRTGFILMGESVSETTIRLLPNSAGFGDANAPIGMFMTGSERGSGGQRDPNPTGAGNIAFRHGFYNLTLRIGPGNPGAAALDLVVTNRGGVYDVNIIDEENTAFAGIMFVRAGAGPALLKRIAISGFRYGLYHGNLNGNRILEYSLAYEDICLINQRQTGLYAKGIPLSVHNLVSYNNVRAIDLTESKSVHGFSRVSLYPAMSSPSQYGKASISVREEDPPALVNEIGIWTNGRLKLREVENHAYQTTLRDISVVPNVNKTGNLAEYYSDFASLHNGNLLGKPIELPVLPAPLYYSSVASDWVNVEDFGASRLTTNDSLNGIQQAIDTGKPIVYLPNGSYTISNAIRVRGGVKKIIGMAARIVRTTTYTGPAFIFEDSGSTTNPDSDFTILEHLRFDNILHNCKRTLVVRHANMEYLRTTELAEGGSTFLEDIMGFIESDFPHYFWCRQLDSEFEPVNLKVTGGTLWVNGYKTENDAVSQSINAVITSGARVNIINSHIFSLHGASANPGIIIKDSEVDITYRIGGVGTIPEPVKEIRYGVTKVLTKKPNAAMYRSRL